MKPTPETDNCARVYEAAGMPAAYRVLLDSCQKLEQERDKWKAAHDNQVNLKRMLMDRPDLKERSMMIEKLIAERDQLRKVCDELANIIYFHSLRPQNSLDSYNSLPHVIERNKTK